MTVTVTAEVAEFAADTSETVDKQRLWRGAEVLPGYRVLGPIHLGRQFEILDCWSLSRQARCVVKVLRPQAAALPFWREQLLLEGRLLVTLDHPHLVRGYEVRVTPRAGVVLETLGGATVGSTLLGGARPPSTMTLSGLTSRCR